MKRLVTLSILCVFAFSTVVSAQEKLPPGAKLVKLEVAPASIELKTPFEYRQLLVTGVLDNGDRVDLTRLAEYKSALVAGVNSASGQVRPRADGEGVLRIDFAGKEVKVPVKVSGQKA